MKAQNVALHVEWQEALKDFIESPIFDSLANQLKSLKAASTVIFPPGALIFNAYNLCPPSKIKVVILGQDPYHNPGEAMGLSFSVPQGIKVPPSLRNIYKELARDLGIVPPIHGDLTSWSQQGVFLLNAILTVEKNKPASHRNLGWEQFTDHTITHLSEKLDNLVFMLWGNFAKNKAHLIDESKHLILKAAHPSPLAGNSFQGCGHFSKANAYLLRHNKSAINWNIT